EDVPEVAKPFQSGAQRGLYHSPDAELRDDVLVVLRAGSEVRAQNVIPDVENDLGAELETPLARPGVAWIAGTRRPSDRFQGGDDLLELEEPFPDGVRSKHHDDGA